MMTHCTSKAVQYQNKRQRKDAVLIDRKTLKYKHDVIIVLPLWHFVRELLDREVTNDQNKTRSAKL